MTPQELADFRLLVTEEHTALVGFTDDLPVASDSVESDDHRSDSVAEAIFLRGFTTYESHIEKMFFHYVTGACRFREGRRSVTLDLVVRRSLAKLSKRASNS